MHGEKKVLLDVKDLKKHFPIKSGFFGRAKNHVYAVDGVSFQLRQGETLGLVGESGCGKSTLGRTILRLHEPSDGRILFEGEDLLTLNASHLRAKRREMQMIFQDPFSSLNPRMTVNEILREPFQIHKVPLSAKDLAAKIDELLAVVGLSKAAKNRYPHEFSGGQRQRIGIARSLALKPKLIVADEPVSALDVSVQSQILNLLKDLKDQFNLSYLFIAHDLAVIEHISDSVAVMYLGRIVEYTSSEELYRKPLHPYTKALMASIPVAEYRPGKKARQVLKGDVPSPMAPPSGCYFHPRCPLATELCKTQSPSLRNLGSEAKPHWVACHHA